MDIIFNYKKTLNRLGNDVELFKLLIETFVSEIPVYTNNLEQALSNNRLSDLAYEAHRLKGSCLIIGLDCASNSAYCIEKMVSEHANWNDTVSQAKILIDHLNHNCKSFLIDQIIQYKKNAQGLVD